jgi:hypothetical protein
MRCIIHVHNESVDERTMSGMVRMIVTGKQAIETEIERECDAMQCGDKRSSVHVYAEGRSGLVIKGDEANKDSGIEYPQSESSDLTEGIPGSERGPCLLRLKSHLANLSGICFR